MTLGIEDCIAMSEDGDWYAFPAAASRADVISALADGMDWLTVLRAFNFKRGHVWESAPGWWSECTADDAGATACWIAVRR